MGPWNKQILLYVLGYFIIVLHSHVESYEHERHSKRIKRFLFNQVEEPNTVYSNVTLCCICNDFDKTNTCYEKCRDRREEDLCQRGKLCSTTATLLNDRFYLTTDCVSKDTCRQERAVYGHTQGCLTLNKTDIKNGTKCGYCCQNRDVTSAARECRHNLDHLMDHVYGQNAGTTEKTVTPSSCQGNECQVSKSHTVTRPKLTTNKLELSTNHSWTDYLYKLCTSKVALDGKLYFPYPDDTTQFIECDKAGQGTIKHCAVPLVWNDLKVTCDYIYNIITTVATKSLSTMFKTTSQMTTKSTSSSSSLPQLLSSAASSPTKQIQNTSTPSIFSSSKQMSSPASATSSVSKSTNLSPPITKPAAIPSAVPVSTNTSKVTTKSTLNHLSPEPTLGQNEAICETCTNGADCIVSKCQANHFYCLNVVIINSQGKQTVLKKSCANIYECKYDHSLRNSECGSQGASSLVNNMSLTCQYCCNATSNPIACNADIIPQNITWFEDIASTTSTVEPYTLLNTTEYLSSDSTVSATSSVYNFSSSNIHTSNNITTTKSVTLSTNSSSGFNSTNSQTFHNITTKKSVTLSTNYSSEVHFNTTLNGFTTSAMQPSSILSNISTNNYRSSTTSPQSSSINVTMISSFTNTSTKVNSQGFSTNVTKPPLTTPLTTRHTSRISSVPQKIYTTTTSQAVKTSTKPPPYTIPPRTTKCKVCSGPVFLCEKLFIEKDCAPPNNYCINTVSNQKDGKRLVDRRCDNFQTCYRDWFLGSSDSDKCRRFDERYTLTLQFDCTFCCITDNCNEHIRPSDDTLYKDL